MIFLELSHALMCDSFLSCFHLTKVYVLFSDYVANNVSCDDQNNQIFKLEFVTIQNDQNVITS